MNLRGDRIFGSKENFSLTLSSTDGATYVKPWKKENSAAELSPLEEPERRPPAHGCVQYQSSALPAKKEALSETSAATQSSRC